MCYCAENCAVFLKRWSVDCRLMPAIEKGRVKQSHWGPAPGLERGWWWAEGKLNAFPRSPGTLVHAHSLPQPWTAVPVGWSACWGTHLPHLPAAARSPAPPALSNCR